MPENDAPRSARRLNELSRLLTRLVRGRTYPVVVAILFVLTLSSFGVLLFPKLSVALVYLLMAAVLIIKPSGLFGEES